MFGRASLGSFLLAMFILGFYFFAKWQMAADVQRVADLVKLQKKITAGIDEHPQRLQGQPWADLQRAGVVDEKDAEVLKQYGYEYVPVGPNSPSDAVLFRQTEKNGHERHVYANGKTGYERRWTSPDGKHVLCDLRTPQGGTQRLVQFRTLPAGMPIGDFPIDGYERPVVWNPSGSLVFMDASLAGQEDPFLLWHLGLNQAQAIPLPAELNLENFLSRETRHKDVNWGMNFIEPKRWLSDRELFVFAQGAGTFVDPGTNAKMGFNVIYHVVLAVQPGQCRIQSARKHHFAASPCK